MCSGGSILIQDYKHLCPDETRCLLLKEKKTDVLINVLVKCIRQPISHRSQEKKSQTAFPKNPVIWNWLWNVLCEYKAPQCTPETHLRVDDLTLTHKLWITKICQLHTIIKKLSYISKILNLTFCYSLTFCVSNILKK